MKQNARIYIAGHQGLAGGAILRHLQSKAFANLITRSRTELDLRDQMAVDSFFAAERPEYVFLAAAKVGGIHANNVYPADFIRDNLQIQTNVIDSAYRHGAHKLIFLGSSCIYPKLAPQPMPETCLLTGPLETTNEWYAIAKIAGLKMCQAYRQQYGFSAITVMPTNLYGPGDNFNLETSHVLPALIRRFHEAQQHHLPAVNVWGTGTPRREFLHVDDLAAASVFLMENYDGVEPVNVGWGKDISIGKLADLIRSLIGFSGDVLFDNSKPDGTPRKVLDVSRVAALGWTPRIPLDEGISATYRWFIEHQTSFRHREYL
jgi:GDP-L-fucose synthase